MKEYISRIMAETQALIDDGDFGEENAAELERHIKYFCHERFVHLCVTLAFAVMTMQAFFVMLMFAGIGTLLLFAVFFAMTAAYAWHYYFLENSVQKLYLMADEIHLKIKQ